MKISFAGAEGVGKTTLLLALAEKLDLTPLTGITRKVPKELRGTREGQYKILDAYSHIKQKDSWICDRTLFDVCTYSMLNNVWTVQEVHSILSQYNTKSYYPDYIFYIPIEFPLIQDGERPESGREEMDNILKFLLNKYCPGYGVIKGTVDERVEAVCTILKL